MNNNTLITRERAIEIASSLDLPIDRPTLRRIARGNTLHQNGAVKKLRPGVYRVDSQYAEGYRYRVRKNGSPAYYCDCDDWTKTDRQLARENVPFCTHICKHGIAVYLTEE